MNPNSLLFSERERERESSKSIREGGGGCGPVVLGKLLVPARVPLIWIIVGQGPIALAVGAGEGCLDIFSLIYLFFFSFSLFRRRPDID